MPVLHVGICLQQLAPELRLGRGTENSLIVDAVRERNQTVPQGGVGP